MIYNLWSYLESYAKVIFNILVAPCLAMTPSKWPHLSDTPMLMSEGFKVLVKEKKLISGKLTRAEGWIIVQSMSLQMIVIGDVMSLVWLRDQCVIYGPELYLWWCLQNLKWCTFDFKRQMVVTAVRFILASHLQPRYRWVTLFFLAR